MSDYLTIKELRTRKDEQLFKILAERRERLRRLKFQIPTKQVKNLHEPRFVKKEIARIMTVLAERDNTN